MLVSSKWILGTSNRIIIINDMTRFPLVTQLKEVWEKWETNEEVKQCPGLLNQV